jgi:hypothetical protein
MASNIRVGEVIRVSVRFVNYDAGVNNEDVLIDPTTATLAIYKLVDDTFILQVSGLTPTQSGIGEYYYDWTPGDNGCYRLLFVGTFDDATPSTVENPRDFFVGTAEPVITLGSTYEALFLPALDPLYLDPEAVSRYYSDVVLVEAAEIIYRLSVELQEWFGVSLVVTPLMEEYLLAATLCELTKIHVFDGGMNGFTDVTDFTLGDLQVSEGKGGSFSNKALNRGNVSTWCELANLLRGELTFTRTGIKAIVRGSNYPNPIPPRALRRFE